MDKEEFLKLYWDTIKQENDIYFFKIDGFDCCIKRCMGHLNWYVWVNEDSPFYGLNYSTYYTPTKEEEYINNIKVHWGLTYAWPLKASAEWYDFSRCLGFDTAHLWDLFINDDWTISSYAVPGSTYKDYNYVRNEVEKLATQLKNFSNL